ncbi:MAG: hypothetical protein KDC98_01020, partial [Planctomycetes bacterium]|nr:hypothetical protein [Planctomycetota bacterium]
GAFLAAYWFLVLRPCPNGRRRGLAFGLALLALIATPWLPQPPLWIAGVLALLTVAVHTARTSTTST